MRIPESSNSDLFDILQEGTEIKNTLIDDSPEPNISDFEPELKEPEIIETVTETEAKPLNRTQCFKNATAIVEVADSIGATVLPSVYKKQKFGNSAKFNEAKALYRIYRNSKEVINNSDEQKLVDLYTDYLDYKDDLPLTDDEKETISKPLGEVLFKHQKNASPEIVLMIAIGSVYIPKIIPLIFK